MEPTLPRRTDRLVLRPLRDSDAADVLAYRSRADVNRWLDSEPFDAAETAEWVARRSSAVRVAADGDRLLLGVELDGRVVGHVMLLVPRLEDRSGEIGWVFHPDVAGRGLATEAACEVVRLAFEELDLHRVFAQLDPRNTASARLCERLGMRREALLRESSWFKGEWGDLAIYGLLRKEWSLTHEA